MWLKMRQHSFENQVDLLSSKVYIIAKWSQKLRAETMQKLHAKRDGNANISHFWNLRLLNAYK